MLIFAAILASGQALPWFDRPWLKEQVRLEASASDNSKPPVKLTLPASSNNYRKLMSYENTSGM
jgi:hypothetical protein